MLRLTAWPASRRLLPLRTATARQLASRAAVGATQQQAALSSSSSSRRLLTSPVSARALLRATVATPNGCSVTVGQHSRTARLVRAFGGGGHEKEDDAFVTGPKDFGLLPREDVLDRIAHTLKNHPHCKADVKVTSESNIAKDLELDSLDQVEVMLAIESEFQVEFADDEADACITVNDIATLVCNNPHAK